MLGNGLTGRQPGGGEPLAHPLGFVRAERGWTYQDLVDAVARRVRNMSARREKAWRWEHRGVVPDRETQEALAAELGVPRDVVNALGWPAWLPVGDCGGIAAPWTPDGCLTALDATAGSALLDRRGFLISGAGSVAATAAQWLALGPARPEGTTPAAQPPSAPPGDGPVTHRGPSGSRPGTPSTPDGLRSPPDDFRAPPEDFRAPPDEADPTGNVAPRGAGPAATATAASAPRTGPAGTTVVEGLERRLPHLRAVEHALGGGRVRRLADAELRMVTELLLSDGLRAMPDATVRRLFGVAAELAQLAGSASLDTGHQAAAERYLAAALSAAHAAGDRLLGANVLRCLSAQYLDAGRPHDALALARAARAGLPGGAPAQVAAMLAMWEAQIHAALGEAAECDALIDEAGAAMTEVGGPVGDPDWAADFAEAEFRMQAAVCHALLHRYTRADRQLTRALLLHPAERARDRAMYLVRHAEVALAAGDAGRGHRLAEEAAAWAARVESLRVRHRLDALYQQLRRQRDKSSARDKVEGRARSLIA